MIYIVIPNMNRFGLKQLPSMGHVISQSLKPRSPVLSKREFIRCFYSLENQVQGTSHHSWAYSIYYNPIPRNWARSFKSEADNTYLVKVPKMGDSITEGTISAWKKSIGDYVKVDDVICVIDTDKVSVDIHTDVSGSIVKYAAKEGEAVYVGGDLVSIDTSSQPKAQETEKTQTNEPIAEDMCPPHKKGYIPMICFPDRSNGSNTNTSRKPVTPENASFSPPSTRLPTNVEMTIFEDPPGLNTAMNISDEEIEIINSGGISQRTESKFGKWKNYTNMV